MTDAITPYIIYILIPLLGVLLFYQLKNRIAQKRIPNPPLLAIFLQFACYGNVLILVLSVFFWYWSGILILNLIVSIYIAPIMMLFLLIYYAGSFKISQGHRLVIYLSGIYLLATCCYFAYVYIK